jgi:hypothetical protein
MKSKPFLSNAIALGYFSLSGGFPSEPHFVLNFNFGLRNGLQATTKVSQDTFYKVVEASKKWPDSRPNPSSEGTRRQKEMGFPPVK